MIYRFVYVLVWRRPEATDDHWAMSRTPKSKMRKARNYAVAGVVGAVGTGVVWWMRKWMQPTESDSAVNTTGRADRTVEIARAGARVATSAAANRAQRVFASAERKEALDAELELKTAEQVAAALGNMKGAMMKVGQLASFVDDGMPEPVRQALAQLQQDAPPMAPELANAVVREELGAGPDELFAEWDPAPIAAASIGQVHRAMTKDGRAVAVKVQYPGVGDAIRADLDNLDLAGVVLPFVWKSLDVKAMAAEIRDRLDEELDYGIEAANQRQFADWYRGHPTIHIPDVVDELSSKRVLTTELSDGVRFAEMETWSQEERNLAAETLYRFVFRSLYRFHTFNGDPHPGNYLFHKGGKVTFLDFGLVKWFEPADIGQLMALVETAIVHNDPVKLRAASEAAGYFVPGAPISDERIYEYSTMFWDPVKRHEPMTITSEYASELVRRLMFAHQTFPEVMKYGAVAPRFVILQRINVGLWALFGRLNATANWRAIAEELWPMTDGPPSTPMGELEAAWWRQARYKAKPVPAF